MEDGGFPPKAPAARCPELQLSTPEVSEEQGAPSIQLLGPCSQTHACLSLQKSVTKTLETCKLSLNGLFLPGMLKHSAIIGLKYL